jgi:glycosyltransferase involved in cell wall biosynthesis
MEEHSEGFLNVGKILILDSTYVGPEGHNVDSLRSFQVNLQKLGHEVTVAHNGLNPFWTIPPLYRYFLGSSPGRGAKQSLVLGTKKLIKLNKFKIFDFMINRVWIINSFLVLDASYKKNRIDLTSYDHIFLPHSDSIMAWWLLRKLDKLNRKQIPIPKISLRFICVFEHFKMGKKASPLSGLVESGLIEKHNVSLFSETERYGEELEKIFHKSCKVFFTPKHANCIEPTSLIQDNSIFIIGKLRTDKGVRYFPELTKMAKSKKLKIKIQGDVENLKEHFSSAHFGEIDQSVIVSLPSFLSRNELCRNITTSSTILSIHNRENFIFRGSASIFEAADHGIPLITWSGSANALTVEKYRIGYVIDNLNEISKVLEKIQADRPKLGANIEIFNKIRECSLKENF